MTNLGTVPVRNYMTTKLMTFTPTMEVMTALRLLVKRGHSGAPVVDDTGKLVGMFTEKECIKAAVTANYDGTYAGQVKDFMNPNVLTLTPDSSLLEAATHFIDSPIKRLPVMEAGRLVGQVSRSDVLRAIDDLS
ncbi:MAG: CBS domain-containing protein [Pseudomonadota bacterium]